VAAPLSRPASDITPASLNPATSVRDAAQIMTRGHFRHLPVSGDSGPAGIVDITDICRALIDPDISQRPTTDTALNPDGLTPAANEPPPGTGPGVASPRE
jgi:CBS domain-containing protein